MKRVYIIHPFQGNVVSFDGSRIMGVDKQNPRVEIEIESCEVM